MTHTKKLKEQIGEGAFDRAFARLYPRAAAEECKERYLKAVTRFEELYGPGEAIIISAPGRTEVGGNHTDHQRGRVLAAAVDLDVICVAASSGGDAIRLKSEGFSPCEVSVREISPGGQADSSALVRGVADWFLRNGFAIGGFNAYTDSRVLKGSGLSSSAAFEVAVGGIVNAIFNGGRATPSDIAKAGQYAENVHFGKPSGLMDQMASAVGGFVAIDFKDPAFPLVEALDFDLIKSGYHLCVVDSRAGHENLTEDYASIPIEMLRVAACFGKEYLREVDQGEFDGQFSRVRREAGDRAALRAMHFFMEDRRASQMAEALRKGEMGPFLELAVKSGRSSYELLQNVLGQDTIHQELAVALAWSERILEGKGAWRVQGGGFAGTIQAFVPEDKLNDYITGMTAIFGEGACHLLRVRPLGVVNVVPEP
ncbi:MAG: galactokinase [Oscillospiraceae bacterium]|jgi:galactokinase|nr:galactokinase [Oscillospiraceae bacterium]